MPQNQEWEPAVPLVPVPSAAYRNSCSGVTLLMST